MSYLNNHPHINLIIKMKFSRNRVNTLSSLSKKWFQPIFLNWKNSSNSQENVTIKIFNKSIKYTYKPILNFKKNKVYGLEI